ncbi:hypothetical protein [Flavobacterium caseinilyticum]|uniref:Uncharacterized protein n=1 Tax=Flavobacterium caseinilyticum TaxID=2541732 RepID=A0A4R5AQT3_9FLAO|nr:hypothetical protein [Flavobacterium caseinilyticum]TDD75261.1 hypothetical protein E0F89_12860 [Flavobacterium caseinilyticum]
MVSKKIQFAVDKVIEGEWTLFDFLSNFKDVNTKDLLISFFWELRIIYKDFEQYHNFNPFYSNEGELLHYEKDNFNPKYFDELEIIYNYYKKLAIADNQNIPEAIDLSDTKAIDKILYLHKLGVIDFLRGQQPFNTSVNSLASVLSAITGEKSGTLQPMLNPMLSKKVDDTNNPLNSKKAVERVEKQLINIGFNLNETN